MDSIITALFNTAEFLLMASPILLVQPLVLLPGSFFFALHLFPCHLCNSIFVPGFQ
jgi:hypothetical protein